MIQILLFLLQPIQNFLYSSINYLVVQMLWQACFYPIVSAAMFCISIVTRGIAWCVYNFFKIPFIKNFVSDICEVFSDVGSAIENSYSFIRNIFSKLPDEIGVKTDIEGVKGYAKYVANNIITIAGFGYLSYHFYNNYYKLFKLDHELNECRSKYELERIKTHYPINLFITGTVAALQFSACVASAITVVLPNSSVTKFRALAIAGIAELALSIYKYHHGTSMSDLQKFESYKTELEKQNNVISDLNAANGSLSAQLQVQSDLNIDSIRKSSSATYIMGVWGKVVSVILEKGMNNDTKVAQLLQISNSVTAVQTRLLQNGGAHDTTGVNI